MWPNSGFRSAVLPFCVILLCTAPSAPHGSVITPPAGITPSQSAAAPGRRSRLGRCGVVCRGALVPRSPLTRPASLGPPLARWRRPVRLRFSYRLPAAAARPPAPAAPSQPRESRLEPVSAPPSPSQAHSPLAAPHSPSKSPGSPSQLSQSSVQASLSSVVPFAAGASSRARGFFARAAA